MKVVAALLVLMLTSCATAPDQRRDDDVVQAAQRIFDAMERGDASTLATLLHPEARMVAVIDGETRIRTGQEWVSGIAASREPVRERMWNPRVRVDGDLASLWAPYDLHIGDRFSHCGTNAMHFVRSGTAWRLVSVTFTVQKEDCAR